MIDLILIKLLGIIHKWRHAILDHFCMNPFYIVKLISSIAYVDTFVTKSFYGHNLWIFDNTPLTINLFSQLW